MASLVYLVLGRRREWLLGATGLLALVYAVGLAVAALLFDPLYGINKTRATPAWCFLCSSLTALTWAALYWIMDVRGGRTWSAIVRPAGANPLMAYILHPFVLMVASFVGLPLTFYKRADLPVAVNILGCLTMAFAIVGLTGLIGRLGYRLKV